MTRMTTLDHTGIIKRQLSSFDKNIFPATTDPRNKAVTTGEATTFLATSGILLTSRRTGERRITTVTMRVITTDRK